MDGAAAAAHEAPSSADISFAPILANRRYAPRASAISTSPAVASRIFFRLSPRSAVARQTPSRPRPPRDAHPSAPPASRVLKAGYYPFWDSPGFSTHCYRPFLSLGAGRNPMVRAAGIVIARLVRGLKPARALRRRTENVPKSGTQKRLSLRIARAI